MWPRREPHRNAIDLEVQSGKQAFYSFLKSNLNLSDCRVAVVKFNEIMLTMKPPYECGSYVQPCRPSVQLTGRDTPDRVVRETVFAYPKME